jgi:methionyl-tRNA formyltransferase
MVNGAPGPRDSNLGPPISGLGPRLRVVYFGTPAFAVPSLERVLGSRHPVVAVVSQPDRPRGRGQHLQPTPTKQVALAHEVPVLQPAGIKDEAFLQAIRELRPDLGVVAAFGRILPDALLAIPRLGMINVHASLLPRYRGAAPVHRAVLAGDVQTGVTIMRVVSELDAGPMFAARTIPIAPDATSGDVEATLAVAGAELLLTVVDDLAAGRAVMTPQNDALATHAAKITKEEGTIDWTEPARAIHNKVRGLQPWPLASTTLGGVRYVIRRSGLTGQITAAEPGAVAMAHGDDLIVGAGGGSAIRILELQPEGRRSMTAREFLAGHHLVGGDRFGT